MMIPEINMVFLGVMTIIFGYLILRFWVKPLIDMSTRTPDDIKIDTSKPEYLNYATHPEEVYRDGQYVQLLGKVDVGTPEWTKYVGYVKEIVKDLQQEPYVESCKKLIGILQPHHDLTRVGQVPNYRKHDIYICRKCGYAEAGWGSSGVYYENYYQHVGYADPSRERSYESVFRGPIGKPKRIDN